MREKITQAILCKGTRAHRTKQHKSHTHTETEQNGTHQYHTHPPKGKRKPDRILTKGSERDITEQGKKTKNTRRIQWVILNFSNQILTKVTRKISQ